MTKPKSHSWIEQWMSLHALILLSASLLLVASASLHFIVLPATLSFLLLFFKYNSLQKNWAFVTQAANLVTSFRLLSILSLLLFFSFLPPLFIGLIALVVLGLDGLDGFLARKYETHSDFGAYLDMETDAFYVLSLSTILYQLNYFGAWILAVGLLRYVYFLALRNAKAPEQKEERFFSAQVIAVILMATMAACFILPAFIHQPAMWIAAVLVFYSFGKSFWSAVS